jgi:hypothetical protein
MNLRDDNTGDSLWLLLDTICNAFGGMLLIAILFALFSGRVRVGEIASRVATLNAELQERRISLAEHDLELARQSNARLQALTTGSELAARANLVTKRDELRADAEALHRKTTRLNTSITDLRDTTQQIPEERLKELRKQLDSERREKTDQENNLAAARQNLQRLQARLADLQNQAQAERQGHVVKLRLPKENVQSKTSFPVIIRYGQIYFVHDPDHSFNRNTDALSFEPQWNDDVRVKPIQSRGVDMRAAPKLLRNIPSQEFYIVCWVYGDSFHSFNQFKQLITNSGYEYGWSPMSPDDFLTLTDRKITPPPPL